MPPKRAPDISEDPSVSDTPRYSDKDTIGFLDGDIVDVFYFTARALRALRFKPPSAKKHKKISTEDKPLRMKSRYASSIQSNVETDKSPQPITFSTLELSSGKVYTGNRGVKKPLIISLFSSDTDDGFGIPKPTKFPKNRDACINGPRPCPHISCKYHLYLDINAIGSIKLNFPHIPPNEMYKMPETCALDVADGGECSCEDIGILINLTYAAVQLTMKAIRKKLPGIFKENDLA